jgi:glycosyltransferase involved in cell wall biosynthesis
VPHQTRRLLEAQAQLGHEILTASLFSEEPAFQSRQATVSHFQARSAVRGLRALRRELEAFRPDVAHVSAVLVPTHHAWTRVLRRSGVPYVVSPHGLLNPIGINTRFNAKAGSMHRIWMKKSFARLVDLPLLRCAAGLHAQADHESELLAGFGLANVYTVPLGVDREWIGKDTASRLEPHAPITFSYLGRIDIHHKGLDLVLAGFRELARRGLGKDARLIIAGSDVAGSRRTILQAAHEAGLANVEVRDPAWGAEKDRLWEETDYFLGIFRYAGMARATAEALGHGIPVIASRESNWGDWVRRHNMGFCVAPEARAVSEELCRIVAHETAGYAARAENARSFAVSHSWQWVAAQIVRVYEILLARGG